MNALATISHAALPVLARVAEMFIAASLLAVLAWAASRTRWLQQRPAVAAAMWFLVLAKAVMPWGPHLTWHYRDAAAGAAPINIEAQIHAAQAVPSLHWWQAAIILGIGLWLAGALWRMSRRVSASSRLASRTQALPAIDATAQHVVRDVAALVLGESPIPDVRVSATATTPFCVGLLQPRVVVPTTLLAHPARLRAALAHEFAHLRRRDLAWRALQLLVLDMVWCFPVAQLASRRIDAAREAACDAIAVSALALVPSAYGALLLDVALARGPRAALGMAGNGQLRSRITGLAYDRKQGVDRKGWALLVGFAAVATLSVHAQAKSAERPCYYSAELAESLLVAHPEADRNADGELSRDEVCGFEPWREPDVSDASEVTNLLASMCCNCQSGGGTPSSSLELGPQACVEGAP